MYLFDAEIIENRRLADDISSLRLEARPEFVKAGSAGRFVMLASADERLDPLLKRPFGIVRCGRGWFEVVIKEAGKGSRNLAGLRAGVRVAVHGPLGNGYPELEKDGRPLVLVAGGIGIASIASVVFSRNFDPAALLFGAARAGELVLLEELKKTGGGRLEVAAITDDGSSGRRGLVTELLEEKLEKWSDARVFACGPGPMLQSVQRVLQARGVEGWLSLENRMACGFGVCLGCVQEMRAGVRAKVCTDGPVLVAGEVVF